MSAVLSDQHEERPVASSMLRTLALCDLVNSTALVERLGDREAAELIRKHDRLARTLADRHGGKEIDKTDGFMMMFDRPIQAVAFALDYQRGLKQLNAAEHSELAARVGIHVGDVVVWDNTPDDIAKGAKPLEVEGLVKPITSRLMSLALPGQILLSNIAYALAHRAQGELGEQLETVRWRTHGRYRFRGVPDPVPVFEVGEEGLAPLKAPPWSSKAHREVPFWRRPATVVIEALVVLILIAIPAVMFLRPDPAIAFASRDWVVVGSLNNLTGETVFDDALESALRIGLEQSRYVNVLPDLKVRDTITRMQRDPDTTEVNREVGSEVAIRDGARALILPTIAEIGGRVRITAEVIDPQTQTTVYSESADGIGKESILPSLDTINDRLRVRLGEALATVAETSLPLEKVTTGNIDALKIYSRSKAAYNAGDMAQAKTLLENAIALDPGFASARISLSQALLLGGKPEEAREQLMSALKLINRLTARDKLMAEAMLANLDSPRVGLQKWKALATSFPDFFPAQGSYGYFSWIYDNNYPEAIEATRLNVREMNPNRGTGLYLLGMLLTGAEMNAEALAQFDASEKLGIRFQNTFYAAAYAADRQFGKMEALLAKGRPDESSGDQLTSRQYQLAFAIDQGKWSKSDPMPGNDDDLRPLLDLDQNAVLANTLAGAGVIVLSGTDREKSLKKLFPGRAAIEQPPESSDPRSANASILFRAWIQSRYSGKQSTPPIPEQIVAVAESRNFPSLTKLHALVMAQRALANKDPESAELQIRAQLDGRELNAAHLVLMESLAEQGKFAEARDQARWLASHRGRAYAQQSADTAFLAFDVAQTNLALLYDAEYSLKLDEPSVASQRLASFQAVWPKQDMPEWIAARVSALELAIESKVSKSSGA